MVSSIARDLLKFAFAEPRILVRPRPVRSATITFIPEKQTPDPCWIGVDLGHRNLAVATEIQGNHRQILSGTRLQARLRKLDRLYLKLRQARSRNANRVLEKRRRVLEHAYLEASNAVVAFALKFPEPHLKLERVVPEELATLKALIMRKALHAGIPCSEVDGTQSSQRCFCCGKVLPQNRQRALFRCECGYRATADLNAARNLAQTPIDTIGRRGYKPASEAVGTAESLPRTLRGQRPVSRSAKAHAKLISLPPILEDNEMPDLMKDLTNATTDFVNGSLDNLKSLVDKTAEEVKNADLLGITRSVIDSTIDNTKNVIDKVSETRANDPFGMAKNLIDSSLEATKNVINTVAEETKRADVIGTANRVAQKGFDVAKEQAELSIDTTRKVADTLMASAPKMNNKASTVTKVEIETETKAKTKA